jgi:hypothetical protein
MSRVSGGHVRNLVPDTGGNGHVRGRASTAWLSRTRKRGLFRHGWYLVPDVSGGAR